MWLWIVLIAHLLNALSFVVSKFILGHIQVKPAGYAGIIGIASIVVTALVPWGFSPLSFGSALIALATGAVFIWAVYFFFVALDSDEVSTVVPVIGATIPVITLIFAAIFLRERLSFSLYVAVGVLIIGTICMLWKGGMKLRGARRQSLRVAVIAAVLFALSSIGMKYIFNHTDVINGFIWTRWGSVAGVGVFLLSPVQKKYVKDAFRVLFSKSGLVFGLGESFGGAGFIVLTYALSLASPTVINALQGVQYALLLAIAILGWIFKPDLLKESFTRREIIFKTIGIVCIGIGVWIIAGL